MKEIIWILLVLAPFYFNFSMRKAGAYKLFNLIQKIGFVIGFVYVTCNGIVLLCELGVAHNGLMLALCTLSVIIHFMVSIGKIKEPYQDDPHYPYWKSNNEI